MLSEFSSVYKNKNFVYLWSSQILSQVTINIMNFLLLVRLFEKTESTIATSLLWVAYAIPAILVGPIGASAVDMIERRKILMITNLFQSLIILLYAFTHRTTLFLLYGVAMVYSFLNQFYLPAESASLPALVKKNEYPLVNGLFFVTQQGAMVLGFGLSGILNNLLGFSTTLFLCGILIFLAFISVSFLPKMGVEKKIPGKLEEAILEFFKSISEGYKFIKGKKFVLVPFLLLAGFQIALAIIMVNVPKIGSDILKININNASLFLVVPSGLGAVFGALIIPQFLKKGHRKKKIIEMSILSIAVAISFFNVLPLIYLYSSRIIVGFILSLVVGLSFMGIVIPAQTFLQEVTPGGLRGRVFGNYWFVVTIATVFPVIFSGTITELLGINVLLTLLAALAFFAFGYSKKYGQELVSRSFSQEITRKDLNK